jgi:S1-C subfamily serine protease
MVFVNCPKCDQRLHLEPPEKPQGIRCPACKHEFILTPQGRAQPLAGQTQPSPVDSGGKGAGGSSGKGNSPSTLLTLIAAVGVAVVGFVVYKTVIVPNSAKTPPRGAGGVAGGTNRADRAPKPNLKPAAQPALSPVVKPVVKPVRRAVEDIDVFSQAAPASLIAGRISPSVAILVMEDAIGRPLRIGSGFVVAKGVIATNMQVIEGASRGYAKMATGKSRHEIQGVAGSDIWRGLVLLGVNGAQAAPLTIATGDSPGVGDEICAVGNPRGFGGAFSAGIVSSVWKVGGDSLLQITAGMSSGGNGGPVVNSKGHVIGVSAGRFKDGRNLNFAIPGEYLSALIRSIKTPVALSTADSVRRSVGGSCMLNNIGQSNAQGVQGGEFLWKYSHGQTGNYSFSLRNRLGNDVKNVVCLVVFYGKDKQAVEVDQITHSKIIPAGLAGRVASEVDASIHKLTTRNAMKHPYTRIEFRILQFDIAYGEN